MNKFVKKIIIIGFTVCLTSCSLASSESDFVDGPTKLIGVFVTREALPFDLMEATISVDEETEEERYDFDGIEGVGCAVNIPDASESALLESEGSGKHNAVYTWSYPEHVTSLSLYVEVLGINSGNYYVEATLIQAIQKEETSYVIWVNPMYQRADGSVYITAETGIGTDSSVGEGSGVSQINEETIESIEIGETITSTVRITTSLSLMYLPISTTISELDEHYNVISSQTFDPDTMEELFPSEECAYYFVETLKQKPNGENIKDIQLYDRLDSSMLIYDGLMDGYVLSNHVIINWENNDNIIHE